MAEFGCNTNTRAWGEIASLYSPNMTSVYSGGLAYEYTAEANGYGLVDAQFTPNADFERLLAAYKATPNPSDDGGYSESPGPSECPPRSANWEVADTKLPAMPAMAERFMEEGAGRGPGLGDDVTPSQYGGESYSSGLVEMDETTTTATETDSRTGSGSSSTATSSENAAFGLVEPAAVFGIPVAVSMFGFLAGMGLVL